MQARQSLWKFQQDQQRYAEILGVIPMGRRTDLEDEIEIAIFPFSTSPGFKRYLTEFPNGDIEFPIWKHTFYSRKTIFQD
jgi:hypothetical protein